MHEPELELFRESLLGWFRAYQRDLPWRKNRDPYRIWISEIMLQQTRVAAVVPYYEKFLARFPDVHALAEAPESEVLRLWSGLGYYRRARNLQKAARQIVGTYGGTFPRGRAELLKLAGIGAYTASAILSMAFDHRHAVLDGNVARVIARLDAIRGNLKGSKTWSNLQARADELLAIKSTGAWNQAMMELGATVCTPKSPQCLLCPVSRCCEGRKLGIAETLPDKVSKRAAVNVQLVSVVLLDRNGRSLLMAPPTGDSETPADDHVPSLIARLWHFPTSSAQRGAGPALQDLLRRELGQKNLTARAPQVLNAVRHSVTYRRVSVLPYLVEVKKLPAIPGAMPFKLEQVLEQPISNLTRKIARQALKQIAARERPVIDRFPKKFGLAGEC